MVLYTLSQEGPKFLLLQSARHQTWGFAKGHVDANETLVECALREVREETGFNLSADDIFVQFNDCASYILPESGKLKRTIMFLANRSVDPESITLSNEHQQHKWCPLDEALKLLDHKQSQTCLLRAADWMANY